MTSRMVRLHEIANARSGDKGNRLNIALVCRDPCALSGGRAAGDGGTRRHGCSLAAEPSRVVRYDLPKLAAFNFVLDDVLGRRRQHEPWARRPRQIAFVSAA